MGDIPLLSPTLLNLISFFKANLKKFSKNFKFAFSVTHPP